MTITNLTTRLKRRVLRSVAIVAFGAIFSGTTVASVEAKTASLSKDGAEAKTVNENSQHVESTSIKEGAKSGDRLVLTLNGVEFAFRWVEPGEFWMGSPTNEEGRDADERRRRIALSQGFYAGETELTQKQWLAIQAESTNAEDRKLAELYERDGDAPDMPAHSLSWFAAQNFVDALNAGGFLGDANSCEDDGSEGAGGEVDEEKKGENEGWIFRLPSEAEWERAARAGTSTRFFFGDNAEELTAYGNVADSSLHKADGAFPGLASDDGFPYIAPVGRFKPNAWGLHDVVGNCREWTSDWFGWFGVDDNSDEKTIYVDPTGPDYGDPRDPKNVRRQKVARGGLWLCMPDELRSADRFATVPGDKAENLSMRLVLAPKKSEQTQVNGKSSVAKGAICGDRLVLNLRGVEFAFRYVASGTYRIGSPKDEDERRSNEALRDVVISEGYWIAETETTQSQYLAFLQCDKYSYKSQRDQPAYSTSFLMAQDFCDALNAWGVVANGVKSGAEVKQKWEFRLPTSAEWEIAARAGKGTAFGFGDDKNRLTEYGNVADKTLYDKHPDYGHTLPTDDGFELLAPVRSFKPNNWGLYDMGGNVVEWVSDWYGARSQGTAPLIDPTGPDFGDATSSENAKRPKEIRGGHFLSGAHECRAASRSGTRPNDENYNLGFRIVLAPKKETAKPAAKPRIEDGWNPGERITLHHKGVEFAFRYCPPGEFEMGSPESEAGRRKTGETLRRIVIPRGFFLMETELTNEHFSALTKPEAWSDFCYNGGEGEEGCVAWDWLERPASSINWFEANELAQALNEARLFANDDEWTIAIPTEAELEYAYRAGSNEPYGGKPLDEIAWFDGNTGKEGDYDKRPRAVAQKKPNAWGLYDTLGNVYEWAFGWSDFSLRDVERVDVHPASNGDYDFAEDRKIADLCKRYKVLRGGSFRTSADNCRAAAFVFYEPDREDARFGVRLAIIPKSRAPEIVPYEDVKLKKKLIRETSRMWSRAKKEPGDFAGLEIINEKLKRYNEARIGFRWVPGGTFVMGSVHNEAGRNPDETRREVTLSQGFWMMETEVPQILLRIVTGKDDAESFRPWRPATHVTYYDCLRVAETLNANNCAPKGYRFELPTEAQWERACRAGTTSRYYWGDEKQTAVEVLRINGKEVDATRRDIAKTIEDVGYGRRYNGYELYDMIGNVSEWCLDSYGVFGGAPVVDPLETFATGLRVHRGGSVKNLGDSEDAKRSAARFCGDPNMRSPYVGFRLILIKDDNM